MNLKHVLAPPNKEQQIIINLLHAISNDECIVRFMHKKEVMVAFKAVSSWVTDEHRRYIPATEEEQRELASLIIPEIRTEVARLYEARAAVYEAKRVFDQQIQAAVDAAKAAK